MTVYRCRRRWVGRGVGWREVVGWLCWIWSWRGRGYKQRRSSWLIHENCPQQVSQIRGSNAIFAFRSMVLHDVMKGGIPCMGTVPGRAGTHVNQSKSKPINIVDSAAQDLLKKKSLMKCVFGCKGKITLFNFPKNAPLCEEWMQFVLPGQQWSLASVLVCSRHFGDECFINKAQVDAWIAYRLILKDGAVPVIKESWSWFGTTGCKKNTNDLVLLAIGTQVLVTL